MSMIDDSQLVEQLVRSDAISKKDLRRALDLAKERGKGLYETLIADDLVDERTLIKSVGKILNVRPVWLGDRTPDADVTDRVPRSLAVRNRVLPLKFESGDDNDRLVLAMADPLDVLAMDEIASHTGVDVRPVLAGLGDLARGLERVYGADGLENPQDASSLDALEQAASDTVGDGLAGDSSSVVELGEADMIDAGMVEADRVEADLSDDALEIEDDGLNDDSWAAFFDEAEDVDYTEDSAVISRDMQDRAISSILDAVDSESEDDSDEARKKDEEDSLKSLDEPLSRSQITGGIEPDLGAWEVDGALDGQQSKDYAKIGHLFVYSPEKAAAASEAEIVEEDSEGVESKEEKKKKSEGEKEKESEATADEGEKAGGAGLGSEPSAAIINPLKKLKPRAKPVVEESSPEEEPDDDELVDDDLVDEDLVDEDLADDDLADDDLADEESEADDKTSVGGGFFEPEDTLPEAEAPSDTSEVSESEDDDDDDTSSNTAFINLFKIRV